MSRVPVKPVLFRWARERAGLKMEELAQRFPKYEEWERGETQPTFRQLERFARVVMVPFGYLFLPQPPEEKLPVPDFRTLRDRPIGRASPNLLETLHEMKRRQDWMREYLTDIGAEPLPFIGSVTLQTKPKEAARQIRETLGIFNDWAREHSTWTSAFLGLRRAVEAIGILMMINGVVGNNTRRKLEPAEFRGFVLCDRLAPLIFINGRDFKAAQMFTLAHELAHLWLGRDGVFNLPDLEPGTTEVEKLCNRVAAELLVPETELQAAWGASANAPEPFNQIARRFKVSPIVAARRARDLDLIDADAFFSFLREYEKDERRKAVAKSSSGGDFYQTQEVRLGYRFSRAVVLAAREGRILYDEAYKLTGMSGKTFDRYAKVLGLGGNA